MSTSTVDADCVRQSLERADVAGFCTDDDLARMTAAVVKDLGERCVESRVQHAGTTCPECRKQLSCFPQRSVQAWVLGTGGFERRRHFPKRCRRMNCPVRGKTLWANFITTRSAGCDFYYKHFALPEVFMLTPKFGVTKAWYQQFSRRLLLHYASFWGEAHVHAGMLQQGTRVMHPVNLKRMVAKAWFVMRMLERAWSRGQTEITFNLKETEAIMVSSFRYYYSGMRQRRAQKAQECDLDVATVVLDGHQKLTRRVCWVRRVCGLPHSKLGGLTLMGCPCTPARGQQLCAKHMQLAKQSARPIDGAGARLARLSWPAALGKSMKDIVQPWVVTPEGVERRAAYDSVLTREWLALLSREALAEAAAGQRPDVQPDIPDDMTLQELQDLACTTHKVGHTTQVSGGTGNLGRRRRSKRSGGFLVALTPEGLIMDAFEFMGAESCSQRYLFMARLKDLYPAVRVCLHDDACHLRRFADSRASTSDFAKALAYPAIKYILDRFHARAHVDAWCLQHVHPEIDENAQLVEGRNSSACEQCFSWLRKYKHMFRTMGRWTGNFFVQEVCEMHNEEHVYPKRAKLAVGEEASSSGGFASSSSEATDSEA